MRVVGTATAAGGEPGAWRRREPVPCGLGGHRGRAVRHRERAGPAGAFDGNAYTSGAERLPTTLTEAAALFGESAIARAAFGDDVVDHYLNNARVELTAYDAAVTDWERVRGFERL